MSDWIKLKDSKSGTLYRLGRYKIQRTPRTGMYKVSGPGMPQPRMIKVKSDKELLEKAGKAIHPYVKRSLKLKARQLGTGSRLYNIWDSMKKRTLDPNNKDYDKYGGRGILICRQWRDNYDAFRIWALRNGYSDDLTIDRIDNNVGYSPGNCRWVNMKEQSNNRSTNLVIKYKGKEQSLKNWCEELGLKYNTVHNRIQRLGWTIERAFSNK